MEQPWFILERKGQMTPKRSIIPIFVPHLGCAHDCVFCNQRHISGEKERQSGERVRAFIEEGLSVIPGDRETEVAFYGGSFTAIPTSEQIELLGAALPFLRDGSLKGLRLSTRPDCIDDKTLGRLKEYGVETIELGSQSMCEDVLALSGRGHTAEDTRRAAELIKKAGFNLILQMMTGLPGDTPEKSMYTAREIAALMPDGVRIYPTVIVKDTALYHMWQRGEYREHTVEDAVELCSEILPVFEEKGIPVIRVGLNPTEELTETSAAGGAYHPALGELVRSRIYLKKARELLRAHGRKVEALGVNKSHISMMTGQKRSNILALEREFDISGLKVKAADVQKGEIVLIGN